MAFKKQFACIVVLFLLSSPVVAHAGFFGWCFSPVTTAFGWLRYNYMPVSKAKFEEVNKDFKNNAEEKSKELEEHINEQFKVTETKVAGLQTALQNANDAQQKNHTAAQDLQEKLKQDAEEQNKKLEEVFQQIADQGKKHKEEQLEKINKFLELQQHTKEEIKKIDDLYKQINQLTEETKTKFTDFTSNIQKSQEQDSQALDELLKQVTNVKSQTDSFTTQASEMLKTSRSMKSSVLELQQNQLRSQKSRKIHNKELARLHSQVMQGLENSQLQTKRLYVLQQKLLVGLVVTAKQNELDQDRFKRLHEQYAQLTTMMNDFNKPQQQLLLEYQPKWHDKQNQNQKTIDCDLD
jgi:hypothetical protein